MRVTGPLPLYSICACACVSVFRLEMLIRTPLLQFMIRAPGSSPVSTHLSAVVDRPAHVQTTRVKKISPRLRHPIELKSSLCAIVCRNLSSQSPHLAALHLHRLSCSTHQHTQNHTPWVIISSHSHETKDIYKRFSLFSLFTRHALPRRCASPPFFSSSSFLVSRRVHSLDRLDHLLLKRRRLHLCHTTNHCR